MNVHAGDIPFFDGPHHLTLVDRAEIKAVTRAVEAEIAWPVLGVTLIEGRDPASVRVHFRDGSLIATRRNNQNELKREAKMLHKLWKVGAPVPRFVAISDNYLIEEDLGWRNLTEALAASNHSTRLKLMEAAFAGLYEIKSLAHRTKFKKLPKLFRADPGWIERFVSSPLFLSEILGVAAPPIDYNAIIKSLKMPAVNFVKWGASPCNAYLCEDGSVIWFDWNMAGLSAGYEDVGFLISNENWPLEPKASLALFRRFQADWTPRAETQLCAFAALSACHRLHTLCQEKTDEITMHAIQRLAAHGLEFAGRSRLMRPATPWFEALGSEQTWNGIFAQRFDSSDDVPVSLA